MNGEVQKVLVRREGAEIPSRRSSRSSTARTFPTSVYTRLIDGVNKNLPAFHRYLKLRKRMMGLDQLHYYDLYAPLVGSVESEIHAGGSAEARARRGGAARRRLSGDDPPRLQQPLDRSVPERRQGVGRLLERRRLRRPSVHADQLQRAVRRRQHAGARARAHDAELLTRTRRSRTRWPAIRSSSPKSPRRSTSRCSSTTCSRHIKDDDTRLSLLGNYLENIKGTVFRQTQFAEFELRMHEMAEKGEPITGEALAKLYMDITKRYYGHDQGICIVDDYIAHEWSYIPHFYRDFYVFQYATSFTASEALAEKVKAGDPEAREKLSGVPVGRRIEIPDRSAEGRRRRHDDRRAARPDDEGDESGDGRDGSDSREAQVTGVANCKQPALTTKTRRSERRTKNESWFCQKGFLRLFALIYRASSGCTSSTAPLHRIATPMHSRMNDERRRKTAVPVSPR